MSVWSDEYRATAEDTLDAMRALLDASHPDSWSSVRLGYGQLRRELDNEARERQEAQQARERAEQQQPAVDSDPMAKWRACQRIAHSLWVDLPRDRRETLVLDLLGDHGMIIREMTEALDAKLRTPECEGCGVVFQGYVRSVVMRMWREGQLDRTPETFAKTKTRYRYSVRRALDGPIADLDRAFHEDEDA